RALSIREARSRHHEYLCIEHVLFALLEDPSVVDVLQNCGTDTERLRRDLSAYLEERIEKLPEAADGPPERTLASQRILQRAAAHVQSAGREEIEGRDVLVAIFREPQSPADYLLAKQGVTRLDVITYIPHGVSKIAEGDPSANGVDQPDEEDDDEDAP